MQKLAAVLNCHLANQGLTLRVIDEFLKQSDDYSFIGHYNITNEKLFDSDLLEMYNFDQVNICNNDSALIT
ncbi:hypothetical protein GCM10027423_14070 [Spirosoma arcticum]